MKELKTNVLKLICSTGFLTVNKAIIKALGLHEAILLGELSSMADLHGNDFFCPRSNMTADTGLSDSQLRKATKALIAAGLISIVKRGVPCKYYYTLNEDQILKMFSASAVKSEALVPKEVEHRRCKKDSTNSKNLPKNLSKNHHNNEKLDDDLFGLHHNIPLGKEDRERIEKDYGKEGSAKLIETLSDWYYKKEDKNMTNFIGALYTMAEKQGLVKIVHKPKCRECGHELLTADNFNGPSELIGTCWHEDSDGKKCALYHLPQDAKAEAA